MTIRNIVATLALAAAAGPVLADIPDGHGGRTSPQASPRPAVAAAHACCPRTTVSVTTARPASPAERKVVGEVAWDSRHAMTVTETVPCYRMTSAVPVQYSSPADLKAVGHLNRNAPPTTSQTARCCDSASCPMRKAS